jgi:deazaflavin-dependent oxidoreductase (nitroreductase family)
MERRDVQLAGQLRQRHVAALVAQRALVGLERAIEDDVVGRHHQPRAATYEPDDGRREHDVRPLADVVVGLVPQRVARRAAIDPDPERRRAMCAHAGDRTLPDMSDFNAQVIEEFRANQGRVGGSFEGSPMVLVHHRGRKSGTEYVVPLMYLADEDDADTIYVFASKAGAPTDPEWYRNLAAAGSGTIELGDETFDVAVSEVTGEARDRIFAEQASRFSGFAEYEEKTAGIRTIPVVALRRARG